MMQHLVAELPGLLEPDHIRKELAKHRGQLEYLEGQSLRVYTLERIRMVRLQAVGLYDRLVKLARAGYAPLCSMPAGSYVAPEFDALGNEVSDALRRLRKIIEHCQGLESMIHHRDQGQREHDERQRFPREMALVDRHRELLTALYPGRFLLLYDGAIQGDFADAAQAAQAGDAARGREPQGRAAYLICCLRTRTVPAAPPAPARNS